MNGKQLKQYIHTLYGDQEITADRLDYAISMLDPINYILAHHSVKGHPVTFEVPNYDMSRAVGHRNWQMQILRDLVNPNVKEVNIEKGRQQGMSELGVMAMIYFADIYSFDAISILLSFPSQSRLSDHIKSRIRPVIANNAYYRSLVSDNDSLNQMSIRDSRIFFRSGSSAAQTEGIALNMVMMDEYERYADTPAETSIKEALKSDNKYGLIRRWSTPSGSNIGIDARFIESDQRYWMIKCSHCGHWQVMDFKKNIKIANPDLIDQMARQVKPGATEYVCEKCGKNIDADRWYNCEWVAKRPEIDAHGYRTSQMNCVWITSDDIYRDFLQTNTQWFYNYTLGTPYTDESMKITRQDIFKSRRDYLPTPLLDRSDYAYVVAGIDWGEHWHHIVLLGMTTRGTWDIIRLAKIPTSSGVENIERDLHQVIDILNQYNPDLIMPDRGYNGNYNDLLLKYFGKGRVYSVVVKSARSTGDNTAHFNENDSTVTIDKLMQNLMMMSHIKNGRLGVYEKVDENLNLFAQHWGNVVVRDVEDDKGQPYKEITRKAGD